MERAELEGLDRDALIARADQAGIARSRILTRAELVDELLLRGVADKAARRRSRGLFGRARDLLASAVERGLNLPDAAQRIRTMGAVVGASAPSAPAALPTVTLAEIYVAQGHRDRAIQTLERVLVREPEHTAADGLLRQLRDSGFPVPAPRLPPEREDDGGSAVPADPPEPPSVVVATVAPPAPVSLPPPAAVDECVALPVDATTLFVAWQIRDATVERMRQRAGQGELALRAVVVVPTWDGPRSSVHDHDVKGTVGEHVIRGLPPRAVVRTAVGIKLDGTFLSAAHAPETPQASDPASVARARDRMSRLHLQTMSNG